MGNLKKDKKRGSLFELDGGIPDMKEAFPLALQHVVAMIVGCVTPAIVVAGVAASKGEISPNETTIFIQAALLATGFSTLMQLFPISKFIGSRLPVIMGVSFAYLAALQGIVAGFGIATIFGAQIVGGFVAIFVGLFIKKLRRFFPPLVTGTVIMTVGLSLYPVAVKYMAGGVGSTEYGSMKNWAIAIFTLLVVNYLNHFSKGIFKLASILFGILAGYIVTIALGMVDFQTVVAAKWFQFPQPMHFGIKFNASAIIIITILFVINSIQIMGELTQASIGGLDREPTDRELSGGIVGNGIANIIGAFFGGLPTATFGQNGAIIVATKVVNRYVLGLAGGMILVASFLPKIASLLTTVPLCVLGGATVSVFASITMNGIRLISSQGLTYRNASIVGLAVALGMGVTSVPETLSMFPSAITMIFGSSPVVLATVVAFTMNLILPKDKVA